MLDGTGDGSRTERAYESTWEPGGLLFDRSSNTVRTPGSGQRKNGTDRIRHTDWLGSTRYLSDSTGTNIPGVQHYDGFGLRTAQSGTNHPTDFLWGGDWGYQEEFADPTQQTLRLIYLEQRYYDPVIGQFISPDPIGFAGGLNLYNYCDADPVNCVDPSGLLKWEDLTPGALASSFRKRFLSVKLDPNAPTLQRANEEAYPGLRRGGHQIRDAVGEIERIIVNESTMAALGARLGQAASCGSKARRNWLTFHEAAGGHTISRHVGRTDAELIGRLASSPKISGASTFSDLETAEDVIGRTIASHRSAIRAWLQSAKPGATLPLPYSGTEVIGRGILKGETAVTGRTGATVVLRSKGGGRYYILTAYPR